MSDIFNLVFFEGDLLKTVCSIWVIWFCVDAVLSLASIISDAKHSVM